jgi:hypothetical protein
MWERDCGRGRGTKKTKAIRCGAYYYSIVFTRIGCTLLTCDVYMSDLRHIHDPVLSSLKMEGISLLLLFHIYETRHVSGDTPPIIKSLNLQWQALVFYTWKFVGRVVTGRHCQVEYEIYTLHVVCQICPSNITSKFQPNEMFRNF